jgi:hypothetical protein
LEFMVRNGEFLSVSHSSSCFLRLYGCDSVFFKEMLFFVAIRQKKSYFWGRYFLMALCKRQYFMGN